MTKSDFAARKFYRFHFTLIFCSIFCSAALAQSSVVRGESSIYSKFFQFTDTKQSCCSNKSQGPTFNPLNPEYETYTLTGTYYSLNDNLTATLMLNNKGPLPLDATPTFYSLSGTRLQLAPITVPAASYSEINLRDLLANAAEEFRQGSMKVAYQGKDYQLGAQVKLVDSQRSLIWAEQFVYTTKFVSNRLESVWWLPSENSQSKLIVSNTTYSPVTVTIRG